jgi:hypothetical protein
VVPGASGPSSLTAEIAVPTTPVVPFTGAASALEFGKERVGIVVGLIGLMGFAFAGL